MKLRLPANIPIFKLDIIMLVVKPPGVIEGKNPRTREVSSKCLHFGDGPCQCIATNEVISINEADVICKAV